MSEESPPSPSHPPFSIPLFSSPPPPHDTSLLLEPPRPPPPSFSPPWSTRLTFYLSSEATRRHQFPAGRRSFLFLCGRGGGNAPLLRFLAGMTKEPLSPSPLGVPVLAGRPGGFLSCGRQSLLVCLSASLPHFPTPFAHGGASARLVRASLSRLSPLPPLSQTSSWH